MKLDYWSIDYSDVITIESAQGIVTASPFDKAVKRTIDGTLIGVTTKYFNASNVKTDGIDFAINYSPNFSFGYIDLGLMEHISINMRYLMLKVKSRMLLDYLIMITLPDHYQKQK